MSVTTYGIGPAMPAAGAPDFAGATWIGEVDDADLPDPYAGPVPRTLEDAAGYARARLLVRSGLRVRGFVTVPVLDAILDLARVAEQAVGLPAGDAVVEPEVSPTVTVVVCTRDRPALLAVALDSILALDHPSFEVVVVDNAPTSDATAAYVAALDDPRVRLVTEARAGLARARNLGVRTARGELVAFTDDDVVVDPGWLRGLVAGFARDPGTACVTGLVPTGEIRTATQAWFDARVSWADSLAVRVFRLSAPPADLPLFPFQVGAYGTGANFCLRRDLLVELGGFDEALGVGTPTGGGEDIDLFTRVLLAGHVLVVEPAAVVWHRHRSDLGALRVQARGYGRGLGAWLTKIAMDPRTAPLAARRGLGAARRLARLRQVPAPADRDPADPGPAALDARYTDGLGRLELASVLGGPRRYARARRDGARRTPLRPDVVSPSAQEPVRARPPSTGGDRRTALLGLLAVVATLLGALALVPAPSGDLRGLLLVAYVLLGPGAALAARVRLPASSVAVLVPSVGLTLVTGLTGAMALLGGWHPTGLLVGLLTVSGLAGLTALRGRTAELRRTPRALRHRLRLRRPLRSSPATASWLLYGLAAVTWAVSLPALTRADAGDYGLLVAAPGLAVALALATGGFVVAVRRYRVAAMVAGLAAVIVLARLTVTLVTAVPIYDWTYKHLGVVDYIQRTGTLAADVDIYNQWPGLFTAVAWLDTLTGVSPLAVAHAFAPVVHVLIALAVYELARAFGQTVRVGLVAAFLAEVVNWVGQDYLAPQAVALVLAVAILGLLLRAGRWRPAAWLTVPIFAALTITHQLTPVWVCGIAVVLGVTGHVRPRWIGVVFAVVAGGYIAQHQGVVASYGLLSGFSPFANAQSNIPTLGVAGRQFTTFVDRIPSVLLWLVALAAGALRWLRGRPVWVPAVLGFSSFGLLAGQSYGGEAIFRVFLYSIPGCALLAAPVLVDALGRPPVAPRRDRLVAVGAGVATVVVALCSLQGYVGTWAVNHVTPLEVRQAEDLYRTIGAPALILPVSTGLPERPTGDYVTYARTYASFDRPIVPEHGMQGLTFRSEADVRLVEGLLDQASLPTYLVISQQMKTYSVYYGLYEPGALDRLESELSHRPGWQLVQQGDGLSVFRRIPR